MAVVNYAMAAAQTRRYLNFVGQTLNWLHWFWAQRMPEEYRTLDEDDAYLLFDDDAVLTHVVKDVQRFVFGDEAIGVEPYVADEDTEVTGNLDMATERRMLAWDQLLSPPEPEPDVVAKDYILFDGLRLYIKGGVPVYSPGERGYDEDAITRSVRKYGEIKGSATWPRKLERLMYVSKKHARLLGFLHWDACTSSAKSFRILLGRKLMTTGGFDNPRLEDGRSVFHQWLDPGHRYGYHGGTAANRGAVFSCDMSNAVSLKYAKMYEDRVGVARPKLRIDKKGRLGRGKGFLGMYAQQIVSLMYVLEAVSARTEYPLVFPHPGEVGKPSRPKGWKGLWSTGFRGVATHRDGPFTKKWDVRGLQEQIVYMLLCSPLLPMCDFPACVEDWRLHDVGWHAWADRFEETCVWPELGIT
jgi:hypothetical protein